MQHRVAATPQEQRFERRRRLNTFAQMRQETLIWLSGRMVGR
jgi:hypothetical protein